MASDDKWGYKEINSQLSKPCRRKLSGKAFDAELERSRAMHRSNGTPEDRLPNRAVTTIGHGIAELSGAAKCKICTVRNPKKECLLDDGIDLITQNVPVRVYETYGATKTACDFDLSDSI